MLGDDRDNMNDCTGKHLVLDEIGGGKKRCLDTRQIAEDWTMMLDQEKCNACPVEEESDDSIAEDWTMMLDQEKKRCLSG